MIAIRQEWGFVKSFTSADLLENWCKFVQEVETGYQLSFYDFTHDLSMRDLIEEIEEAVPVRLKREIEDVVRPWDERYFRATRPSRRSIEIDCDPARQWWFRVPLISGQELTSYFLREGLLSA